MISQFQTSGFNASAPLLILGGTRDTNKAVLNNSEDIIFPRLVTNSILRSFTKLLWLSCGLDHCLAVTCDGKAVTWGYGASGVLGHGDYVSYIKPKLVGGGLESKRIIYGECGSYHNGVVTNDGQLYMWGRSDAGQVGVPIDNLVKDSMGFVSLVPMHVVHFQHIKKKVESLSLGEAHTLVLDQEGKVYSFGWSELGQLGIKKLYGK